MKNSDLMLIGLAAAVLGMVVWRTGSTSNPANVFKTTIRPSGNGGITTGYGGYSPLISGVPANAAPLNAVTEIASPDGSTWDNGWRYFSDGTAISPDGVYYLNSNQVYNPAGMYQ